MIIKKIFGKKPVFVLLLISFFCSAALAESPFSVRIESVESRDFPRLEAVVRVEDRAGDPVLTMVRSNFQARVNMDLDIDRMSVERFAASDRPVHYYVLLTNSGLMEGVPVSMQKDGVFRIVDAMRPNDSISVYIAGPEARPVIESITAADFDREMLEDLGAIESQTRILDSLAGLSRLIRGQQLSRNIQNSRSVAVVFSDGRDRESRFTLDEIVADYDRLGIPIFTVGIRILGAQYLEVLNSLSTRTDGFYHFSATHDRIPDLAEKITQQVSMAYLLSFRVRGLTPDDQRHQLMVRVQDRDAASDAYKNFTALRVPFPSWLRILLFVLLILFVVAVIVLMILGRRKERKAMGIGKRKCEDCGRRMKDDWEFCPFCRYLKNDRRRERRAGKKKKKKDKGDKKK